MPPDAPSTPPQGGPRRGDDVGDRDRLEHMRSAARDAVSFVAGRTRADLDRDRMLLRALVQCVLVIGEAAARTSDAGRLRVPELPWARVVGMRHILVHAYFDIDVDAVWRVVVNHLPPLIESLDEALTNWSGEAP